MGHIHMGAWHWTRTATCTARRLAAAILAPSAAATTAVSSTRSRDNVPVLIAGHIARNPEKESWADCLCNGDFSPAIRGVIRRSQFPVFRTIPTICRLALIHDFPPEGETVPFGSADATCERGGENGRPTSAAGHW